MWWSCGEVSLEVVGLASMVLYEALYGVHGLVQRLDVVSWTIARGLGTRVELGRTAWRFTCSVNIPS